MSPSEGLAILRNWQTENKTVFLFGVARFERFFDVSVKVSVVGSDTLVLRAVGISEPETVALDGVEFSGITPGGEAPGTLVKALSLKLPEGVSIALLERRSG